LKLSTILTPVSPSPFKERGKDIEERGLCPLSSILPLPLINYEGKGVRGIGS
jgi:hypothetical protein